MLQVQRQISPDVELDLWRQGFRRIVGIDEVGRGPLAGPVVAAAVAFDMARHIPIAEITDSKKLTAHQRECLAEQILIEALLVEVSLVPVDIIDEINILQATYVAMNQTVLLSQADYVLIDGRDNPIEHIPGQALIKGDARCYSIAAASIVAKVIRDSLMIELDQDWPMYGWRQNKGYGTQIHRQAILQHGPCRHHRQQFLRKLLASAE